MPGITYAAPEGGTQANQLFYLRGFPAGGDLFIDGVRDIGEYNRDLFATESVEVLKGPSALMFGRGSTGGVINQVTKKPELGGLKEVGFSARKLSARNALTARCQFAAERHQRDASGRAWARIRTSIAIPSRTRKARLCAEPASWHRHATRKCCCPTTT